MFEIEKCKLHSVVAFKTIDSQEWYTGVITTLYPPNSKCNDTSVYFFQINVSIPVEPQWYEDDAKTTYYLENITNLILLE